MPELGYSKRLHQEAPAGRGCVCTEELEHDGPCQNALREKKWAMCTPCSQGWHWSGACDDYQTKGFKSLSFQCDRCGWDSAEHVEPERIRALIIDSRAKRDSDGRVLTP